VEAGTCAPGDLHGLDRLVRGEVSLSEERPRLFKSTGMSWEDAVLAEALWRRSLEPVPTRGRAENLDPNTPPG
jgi:ornithine cyclodeaminase/alanine dehydrogenase-like protein (mu-crystallin family)